MTCGAILWGGGRAAGIVSRTAGDRATPLFVQLTQDGDPFDLTGYTVQIGIVSEEGSVKLALTDVGIEIDDAETGLVIYDWSEVAVDTPGTYYVFFIATHTATELVETFPAGGRELAVRILPNRFAVAPE